MRGGRRCVLELLATLGALHLGSGAVAAHAQVPAGAPAAQTGSIGGVVRDSSGQPIASAQLSAGSRHAVSSAQGVFRLEGVAAGPVALEVRRLGFRMATVPVQVLAGQTTSVTVVLGRAPQALAPVVVEARRDLRMRQLQGFYERRQVGIGRFITRDQIEARNSHSLPDLLRSMIPGVRVVSGRYVSSSVRIRGNSCPPLVVLDGMAATAGEFDLGTIDPFTVMGIEVYSGPATVPIEFRSPRSMETCGVVAIWSGLPRRAPKSRMPTSEVERLLDSLQLATAPRVYSAEEVEVPARVDSSEFVNPVFPDSLYARGTTGGVLAQFVVDTTGLVLPNSFHADSSTHRLFTEAVRGAVLASKFVPARHQGRRVRQVMLLPFQFVVQDDRRRE